MYLFIDLQIHKTSEDLRKKTWLREEKNCNRNDNRMTNGINVVATS